LTRVDVCRQASDSLAGSIADTEDMGCASEI
jgi:hypothetical protein